MVLFFHMTIDVRQKWLLRDTNHLIHDLCNSAAMARTISDDVEVRTESGYMILPRGSLTFNEGTSLLSFSIQNESKILSVIADNQPTLTAHHEVIYILHRNLWTALTHDSRHPKKHQVFLLEKISVTCLQRGWNHFLRLCGNEDVLKSRPYNFSNMKYSCEELESK